MHMHTCMHTHTIDPPSVTNKRGVYGAIAVDTDGGAIKDGHGCIDSVSVDEEEHHPQASVP